MDIREEFLNFFKNKGHEISQSAPLIPDDASLLFVNAGMVPFKDIFTQKIARPKPPRKCSAQTCIRAGGKHNDLDNVGYTRRHHTFFEMLGNFSFADYFKKEAIGYAWEFITEVLKLPANRLYASVHESDDEAFDLWLEYLPKDRIYRFGDKDNFWQMGDSGPCGPCSEIFYDQGESFNTSEDYMGGEGDRFLEIWNLVFMQYNKDNTGKLHPLASPSIDTGMGLERICAIIEGKRDNFDSSLFMPIIKELERLLKKPYIYEKGASFRIIADHIRASTFLVAQGVSFDREGRGYVLRRILRRALRHGYLLGFKKAFMYKLVPVVADIMLKPYPYIKEKESFIKTQIKLEEERFLKTIAKGMAIFNEALLACKGDKFQGEIAFKLYDTYGFPLDLTNDMLRELGKSVDEKAYELCMQEQISRARAAWKGSGDKELLGDFKELAGLKTEFIGYESLKAEPKVLALLDEDFKKIEEAKSGFCYALFDKSPFFVTAGGQASDSGSFGKSKVLEINDYFGLKLAKIKLEESIFVGDSKEALVDNKKRAQIAAHHSATHLLHLALKQILGPGVNQAGSLVEEHKLRFDFSYKRALSEEELARVEELVNSYIQKGYETDIKIMSKDEAIKKGAIALFGEKYSQSVRVIKIGDSLELCGGTHVQNSYELGSFYILKESSVSAGVRRIEAVAGKEAYKYASFNIALIKRLKTELKSNDIEESLKKLKEENKELKKSLKKAEKEELSCQDIKGVSVCIASIKGDIKEAISEFKNQHEKALIVLISQKEAKLSLAIGCKNISLKANEMIKELAPLIAGKGGGKEDFAMAGGKDSSKIKELLSLALSYSKEKL